MMRLNYSITFSYNLCRVIRNSAFSYAKALRRSAVRNRAANQCTCLRYKDSKIPVPPKSEISSLHQYSVPVCVGPGRTPRRQVSHDAAHLTPMARRTKSQVSVLRFYNIYLLTKE